MADKTKEQIVAEHKILTDQTIRKMLEILVQVQKAADDAEYRERQKAFLKSLQKKSI